MSDILELRKSITVSDYYVEKGFDRIYLYQSKDGRKSVTLYKPDRTSMTLSYAKYLYTSQHREDVDSSYYQIDHINGDKTDDRLENLQKISKHYNLTKDRKLGEKVVLVCPICGSEFLFSKRNLKFKPNPTCSRRCGGIKSRLN